MDLSDSDGSDPLSDSDPEDSLVPHPNEEAFHSTTFLVCKQKTAMVWLLLLGAFEPAFLLAAPFLPDKQHPRGDLASASVFVPFGLLMATGLLWMGFDLFRGEIRADDKGLTWRRGFGSFKRARWHEVTDFYRKFPLGSRIVETRSGKLQLPTSFQGIDDVAELVVQRLPQAPTGTWMMLHSQKGGKGSLSLSYWSKPQQWTAPFITSLPLSLLGAALYGLITSPPKPSHYLDASSVLGAVLALAVLIFFGVGMLWMVIELWRERRFAWEHRGEELTLNSQGLWYHGEKQQVHAQWAEVRTISRVEGPKSPKLRLSQFRVETDKGDFFLWHSSNGTMWTRFRMTLKQYAPHTLEHLERSEKQAWQKVTDLEGERGAWSGGAVGIGSPQWSYRSRDARFLLQLVSFFGGLVPLLYLLLSYNASLSNPDVPYSPSWPTFIGLWLASALAIGTSSLWFRRAAILAHEEGLEIRSPFHSPHRLAWTDIEGLDTDSFGRFVRARGRKFYLVHLLPPVRREELESLIEQKRGVGTQVR